MKVISSKILSRIHGSSCDLTSPPSPATNTILSGAHQRYNEFVVNDQRISGTTVPYIGTKGSMTAKHDFLRPDSADRGGTSQLYYIFSQSLRSNEQLIPIVSF